MKTALKAGVNPFAMHRIERLHFRLDSIEWPELLARWDAMGRRGAVIGPHGSGKTTLLDALQPHMEARGYRVERLVLSWPLGKPGWQAAQAKLSILENTAVFLDGADLLGPVAWRRFLWTVRRAAGLLVTAHRPGRLAALYECTPSPPLLDDLLGELAPDEAEDCRAQAHRLYQRHGGNLREVFRSLYDLYAGR
jgi:hypothetical protein